MATSCEVVEEFVSGLVPDEGFESSFQYIRSAERQFGHRPPEHREPVTQNEYLDLVRGV